jgi:hypothetical protein
MAVAKDDPLRIKMAHCTEYTIEEWVMRQSSVSDRTVGDDVVTEDEIAVYFQGK